jgi:hypothetical protein
MFGIKDANKYVVPKEHSKTFLNTMKGYESYAKLHGGKVMNSKGEILSLREAQQQLVNSIRTQRKEAFDDIY